MPTYSFLCPNCSTRLNRDLPMDERDTPTHCPRCGKLMKRVPTPIGAVIWAGIWHDPWARREGKADGLGPERGF